MFDFDYAQILRENEVTVEWCDTIVDTEGNKSKSPIPGWGLTWKHGFIRIGPCTELKACEAAAIFVHLYLKGVPAQLSTQLIVAYAFIGEYREAIEMYEGLVNDIESFAREGLDNVRGSMRIER